MTNIFMVLVTLILLFPCLARAFNQAHLDQVRATRNCRACDLSGANLTAANLAGSDLSGSDLSNADLSGANLAGEPFRRKPLPGEPLRRGPDGCEPFRHTPLGNALARRQQVRSRLSGGVRQMIEGL